MGFGDARSLGGRSERGWWFAGTVGSAVVALGWLAGCGQNKDVPRANALGTVAVIDLDAVAQTLGSDKQILQSISSRQSVLNEKLVQLAKNYQEQLSKHQQTLGQRTISQQETPDPQSQSSQVALANWQQQAQTNLTKAQRQVETDLVQHRAQLVAQFREQIKPFAREAARARGLSVIVTRNDSVIYDFTDAVDITSAVVEAIRSRKDDAPVPQVAGKAPSGESVVR